MSSSIGGYRIDVFVVEDHTQEAEATDLPVEEGSPITDHVRLRPGMLAVDCIVSDSPIGALADERGLSDGAYILPSEEARSHMERLIEAREIVAVETSIRTYDDLVLLGIGENVTVGTGKAMRFRATFKRVRIVKNERSHVPVAAPRNAKKKNRGHVPAKAVETAAVPARAVENQSIVSEELYGGYYLTSTVPGQ